MALSECPYLQADPLKRPGLNFRDGAGGEGVVGCSGGRFDD